MRKHYNGNLESYRSERRRRVFGDENKNLPELTRLLGSYIGNHQQIFTTWKEDFEKLYHTIEAHNSPISKQSATAADPNYLSFDQIIAMAISSTCGLPVTRRGDVWTRTPFEDNHISFTSCGDSYLYAHTHFSLDNKKFGLSFSKIMDPSLTKVYRNVFTLYPDGDYSKVSHATATADDRTLVAGHTLWRVKEEEPYDLVRPGLPPAIAIPRLYYFLEYNNRLRYLRDSPRGMLCSVKKGLWRSE